MVLCKQEENIGSLKEQIAKVFEISLKVTIPEEPEVVPLIAACAKKEFGDYQWYINIITYFYYHHHHYLFLHIFLVLIYKFHLVIIATMP